MLIENGMLAAYMQDRISAQALSARARPATAAASPSSTTRCRA